MWVQVPSLAPVFSPESEKKLYYARVVELADSLDSGSSGHYARAGSSPASRTKSDTDFDTMGISLVSDFLRHGAAGFA